jgi:hypothetical protein
MDRLIICVLCWIARKVRARESRRGIRVVNWDAPLHGLKGSTVDTVGIPMPLGDDRELGTEGRW